MTGFVICEKHKVNKRVQSQTEKSIRNHPIVAVKGVSTVAQEKGRHFMIKKKTTLIIKIVLIAAILFTAMSPLCAYANDNGYEPRLKAPNSSVSYYSKKLNRYFQTGTPMPNCVAYAYGRVYEMNGEKPLITHGSAGDWYSINKKNHYYDYGSKPKLGAVACWSNHVAVVEKINNDGSITVSESHWHGKYFNTKTYKNMKSHYGQKFYGYIYTYNGNNEKEPVNTQYKQDKIVTFETVNHTFNLIKMEDKEELDKKQVFLSTLL